MIGEMLEAPSTVGGTELLRINKKGMEDDLLTTGLCPRRVWPYYAEEDVLPTLTSMGEFGGIEDDKYWQCHTRALWGIANIRYRHPGVRTAIALGTRKNPDVAHSLIVLWDAGGDNWVFYDPYIGFIDKDSFEATKILPFPSPGVCKNAISLPGFNGFKKVDNAFLVVNEEYDIDEKDAVLKYLEKMSKSIDNFKVPAGVDSSVFLSKFTLHDRVLYECMKIRYKFRKFPIGMAFGERIKSGNSMDYAVLAFWEGQGKAPIYWGLRGGDIRKLSFNFKPRVVVV